MGAGSLNGGVLTAALPLGGREWLLFPEKESGEGGGRACYSDVKLGLRNRGTSMEVGSLNPSPRPLTVSLGSWGSCLALPSHLISGGQERQEEGMKRTVSV